MGRIDRNGSQDGTLERRHIQAMLRHIDAYELVKRKAHPDYIVQQRLFTPGLDYASRIFLSIIAAMYRMAGNYLPYFPIAQVANSRMCSPIPPKLSLR